MCMHVCLRVLVICVCLGGVSGLCTCECMCSQRPEECVGSPDLMLELLLYIDRSAGNRAWILCMNGMCS